MFVFDEKNQLHIVDFSFDGWGEKMAYQLDDALPKEVAAARDFDILDVPDFVLEGGSVELDGSGTAMLTRSSVISTNRNPDMSQEEEKAIWGVIWGRQTFIWLDGVNNEDITDAHIDGFARFYNDRTLLPVSDENFYDLFEGIKAEDYQVLQSAKNAQGQDYEIIEFPMTAENVTGLDYKGSYFEFLSG